MIRILVPVAVWEVIVVLAALAFIYLMIQRTRQSRIIKKWRNVVK